MTRRSSFPSILLVLFAVLLLFTTLTSAARPTSFCKCSCGTNSTIIPLRYEPPPPQPTQLDNETEQVDVPPRRTGTCIDCNRSFCLENRVNAMPICKESKDEDITGQCFQRDSAKDEAIVYAFIAITVALFGYSMLRPWIRRKSESVQERRTYASIPSGQVH